MATRPPRPTSEPTPSASPCPTSAGGVDSGVSRFHVVFDECGEIAEYELAPSAEETVRIWKAMMLAPSLVVCEALLRGQTVPTERLDPNWVERFGRQ